MEAATIYLGSFKVEIEIVIVNTSSKCYFISNLAAIKTTSGLKIIHYESGFKYLAQSQIIPYHISFSLVRLICVCSVFSEVFR